MCRHPTGQDLTTSHVTPSIIQLMRSHNHAEVTSQKLLLEADGVALVRSREEHYCVLAILRRNPIQRRLRVEYLERFVAETETTGVAT